MAEKNQNRKKANQKKTSNSSKKKASEVKKNTSKPKKKTSKKSTSQAKHSVKNVKKKTENKKTVDGKKNKQNKFIGLVNKPINFIKDKLPKKKPEPKNAKEKRAQQLEKLRAAKKRNKILIKTGIIAAGVYALGCVVFCFVCFPRTVVADTDLSFHTESMMKNALIPNSGEYVFKADGLGFDLEIDGRAIDYNFDVDQVVDRVIELKNPLLWPYEVFIVHDFMTESVVSFNRETATSFASPAVEAHNLSSEKPQNADLVVDPNTREISIKEEVIGNTLNYDRAMASILGYIGSGRRHLECGEDEQDLPSLYADDERCEDAIQQGYTLIESLISLNMSTANVATLNFNTWVDWIQLKDEYKAGLNDEKLATWIAQLADQCDTLGKTRHFVTPYGKSCTVTGGDNIGWQIDQAALATMLSEQAPKGEIVALSVPCSSTLNGYAGPGQRDWGARYIDVDLGQQTARMYDDSGTLIWQSAIVSGKPSSPTPTGVYTIKAKKSPTVLIGQIDPTTGEPSYRSEVQYWMGFVGDMVGLHDASWQSRFGGDWWVNHGSRGCVNLPTGAAANLYSITHSGDIVVVHY